MTQRQRVEFGDWQTPRSLAVEVVDAVVRRTALDPASVVEPTCGVGSFLSAAASRFPHAKLHGYDINPDYIRAAKNNLPRPAANLAVANFFEVPWEKKLHGLPEPIFVLGNPPWVTSAELGVLGSANLPRKQNFKKLDGLDALTGKSNFDVSEWMVLRLLDALQGRSAVVALLLKAAVARRVIEFEARQARPLAPIGLWRINALEHFGASVDAVLFACRTGCATSCTSEWPVFADLQESSVQSSLGVIDGILASDVVEFQRTQYLSGTCWPEWRSGIKHDCSAIMELSPRGTTLANGLGEEVRIEDAVIYPLLKSSDLANGRVEPRRKVLVPQTALGQDTSVLKQTAPRAWAYLTRHRALFSARKSSIYRGQPRFAIFGVGAYSFAPWKVAISGLYKRIEFRLIGPHCGRPTLVDDTCYFLPFDNEADAQAAVDALRSDLARRYLSARVFWDAKRPIGKSLLQSLDLAKLGCPLKDAGQRRAQLSF
jgi:hypothetical protein